MNLLRKWFVYNHGEGEIHQADLYRCHICKALITFNMIRKGGCQKCFGKLSPTRPSFREAFQLLVMPWMFR